MYERVKLKKCGYYFTHRKFPGIIYTAMWKKCILAYLAVKSNIIAFYHKVNAFRASSNRNGQKNRKIGIRAPKK